MFEGLASLLDQCSNYLGRLEHALRGGMDALSASTCEQAIKLRRKWQRLVTFTKVFFLIDHSLKKMDALIDTEGRLVSTQTFGLALDAAVHSGQNLAINKRMDNKMDLLVEDRTNRSKEKESRETREIILLASAFDDGKID